MYLKNLSIILVDTQLPENIGLVARSMFNFGFEKLKLVNPKVDWPNEKALAVSVDASSIIENASIYSSLREALNDETYSIAFTARKRDMNKEFFNSNEVIQNVSSNLKKENIAVIFGGESSGLTNDHLSLVSKCATIDTHTNFSSLNLSHAVNVFCFSVFNSLTKISDNASFDNEIQTNQNDLLYFFDHLEKELEERGFFQPPEKMTKMKQNLRNIFHRADLNDREIATLRGVVTVLTEYKKS